MSLGWIAETHMITVGMKKGSASMHLNQGDVKVGVNIIAALCDQNLIAPFTVEGACNRTVFETWLETCLVPNT